MKNKKTIALLLLLLLVPIAYLAISSHQTPSLPRTADSPPVSPPDQAPITVAQPAKPFYATTSHEKLPAFSPEEQPLDDQGRPLYKPGELLVRFKEGVPKDEIAALHEKLGSTVIGRIAAPRLEKVKLRAGLPEVEAIGLYAASPLVELVERHAIRYPLEFPNDPLFNEQWPLPRISTPEAWKLTRCEPDLIIAVIDTGVDYHHPDLLENIWMNHEELNGVSGVDDDGNGLIDDVLGWDFADEDPYPFDLDGHGTHVAGVIAAVGNNALGTTGVCWNAKIMALKVQADGSQQMESWAVIEAIYYAMEQGARIVNCSFGGSAYSPSEYEAFGDLKSSGILAVCAAGNSGLDSDIADNKIYPAGYDHENILSVAASTKTDGLASFSTFGLNSVHVAAPGVLVKSTLPASTLRESRVMVHGDSGTTSYNAIAMLYSGLTGEEGITAQAFDCGLGYPDDFPAEVSGQIALIERGEIYFSEKATNAKNAGAQAAIIYNKIVDDPDDNFDRKGGTLGEPGDWIPVISLPRADGEAVKVLGTPVVTVVNKPLSTQAAYGIKEGTSSAAPHVSGIAGLILSKSPHLDHVGLKEALLNTVDKVPALSGKIASGGRVNAIAALCSTNALPADLSFDHALGLEDAVIAFRIASGLGHQALICPVPLAPALDINGDGRVGLEEAIYILQHVAGVGR